MSKVRNPSIHTSVDTICIKAGETLTIWLGDYKDKDGRSQVEIRVLPDGLRQVFVDVFRVSATRVTHHNKTTWVHQQNRIGCVIVESIEAPVCHAFVTTHVAAYPCEPGKLRPII